MDNRIYSNINPYVGAKHPVHCSCCDSEVKPAMSIESGYAVVAVSLVEAIEPTNSIPTATVTIKKINDHAEVNRDLNGPQTLNMLSNTTEGASKEEDKTSLPMNIPVKEDEINLDTGETEIKTTSTGHTEKAADNLGEAVTKAPENCVEEQSWQSDEELEKSGVDEVQTTFMVPPKVCRNIRLALDKARFCLQKVNCTTSKRFKELFREQKEHIEALKKLATESLTEQNFSTMDELCLASQEFVQNMEYLKEKMLDCQQKTLLDIISTLKEDVETEFSSLEEFDVQDNEQESDQKVETLSNGSLMVFLKDAPWTFGFTSILVANLGYFLQPTLLQSFHTCFARYLDYF